MKGSDNTYFNSKVYQDIFNQLHLNVCITDMETNRVVYVNNHMKNAFPDLDLEGGICWKVLRKNQTGKCSSCPQETLARGESVESWIDYDAITGRSYQNFSSMISCDGRNYHLHQFYDITELTRLEELAHRDELTGVLSRRAGKKKLHQMIIRGEKEKKVLAVVLYDINELKAVNDCYGHSEGDHLICYITETVQQNLCIKDLFFRLSGDEFVIAFYDESVENVEKKMDDMLKSMKQRCIEQRGNKWEIAYDALFSYGVTEVFPGEKCSLTDVISRADRKMYIQKRAFHIEQAKRLLVNGEHYTEDASEELFECDKRYLYEALRDSTDDYIFMGNMKTGTFRYSTAMAEEFGMPGDVVENAAAFWAKLIHPHDEKGFLESNQEIADGRAESHCIEYRARNVNGEWMWLRCRGKMIRDAQGEPSLFAGFITNLGQRSQVDHITGLYDRFSFEGDIKEYFVKNQSVERISVMVLDMDGFKNINDLYDRSFGDDILRITAQRISAVLPDNAKIYRLDGDEFGIVIVNGNEKQCEKIYESIYRRFQNQQEYNGRKYYCTLSAGYASYPEDADNYLELVKRANYSLEYSKSFGKNRCTRFSEQILQKKESKLEKLELLRESIERGFIGFSVYYQPQVDALTGELLGAEALARWQNSKFGWVSPAEFIPLLEQNGMIIQLGKWICERAIVKCKEWTKIYPDFHMSINLSYRQLQEDDFVKDFQKMTEKYELNPGNITMELTETYLVKADVAVSERIEKLRQIGVLIAMDDFGVGYSSLYSLKNMPVDVVKIDRGFVKDIATDRFNATFVRSITELCHNVGRRVCLEGVEIEEEFAAVQGVGLDMIQGFYFGRPESEEEFTAKWLR